MQSVKDEQAEQCERRDSLINYSAKAQRKRKRLSRIVLEGTPASAGKRRSSISDAGILSESLIDYTASPEKNDSCAINEDTDYSTKKFSMRHNHFMDFYQTELNYVGILETIVKLFKHPLEKIAEENPETNEFLNKSELKAIFGNFLPIYLVHKSMLNSLQEINASWEEDSAIGQIIIDNRDKLIKVCSCLRLQSDFFLFFILLGLSSVCELFWANESNVNPLCSVEAKIPGVFKNQSS